VKQASIFLVIVALIAGMVGCVGGDGDDDGGGEYYTLIVDFTAGGTVTVDDVPIPGKAILTYDPGAVVSLNATPDGGYQFAGWSGNVGTVANVNAASTTITVNGDYSITANFELLPPVQYSLNIIGPAYGSVTTPGEGRFMYEEGTVVNLVAEPASGYEFAKWTGDVDTIADVNGALTTITMNSDYYICGHFRETPVICYANG
jgi:ribosomal protein L21E